MPRGKGRKVASELKTGDLKREWAGIEDRDFGVAQIYLLKLI
jgi:hypothetical protein